MSFTCVAKTLYISILNQATAIRDNRMINGFNSFANPARMAITNKFRKHPRAKLYFQYECTLTVP